MTEATGGSTFFVDVDGGAEPLLHLTGVVADGSGAEVPAARGTIDGADEVGIDGIVVAGSDGLGPGVEDAFAVGRIDAGEIVDAGTGNDVATDVVKEALVGVDNAAIGVGVPEALGAEFGENAVAFFAAAELVFVELLLGDVLVVEGDSSVDGKDAEMEPELEGLVEEGLDGLLAAGVHDGVVGEVERSADGFGVDLPVRFGVEVFGADAADVAGGLVGVGDAPLVVEENDAVGEALEDLSEGSCYRNGFGEEWRRF